jgi:hypothetical protein
VSDLETTILPTSACPSCSYAMDACSPVPGNSRATPQPGDITLCFRCGAVLWFDAQMGLQAYAPERVEQLDAATRQVLLTFQREIRSSRPSRKTP